MADLDTAKRRLSETLRDRMPKYWELMKNWCRRRISKDDFDSNAKLLLGENNVHLHNEFLFAILVKCQTGSILLPPPPGARTKSPNPGNSRSQSKTKTGHLENLISHPPKLDGGSNKKNVELRDFIQEQRKIISSFRSQPWPMKMKMEAIKNYKENVLHYVPQLNTIDTFRDKSSQAVLKEREKLQRFFSTFKIWRSIIKRIEGNFGTSVGSYFRLVRWLCMLNFLLFMLTLVFLIMPQLIAGKGLPVPSYVRGNVSALSFIIDGEGYIFEYSILFYGYYDSGQNETYSAPPYNPDPYIGAGYKLPLAYLLIILMIFMITGGTILYSIGKKYKLVQNKVAGEGQYVFSWRIFASWDYAITDPKRATSKMKQNGIALKEALFEASKVEDTSSKARYKKLVRHIVTNSIVTILLFGTGYAIFLAAENSNRQGNRSSTLTLRNIGIETILNFLRAFQLQLVILLRNFITPLLFKFIALQERFHPRTALKLRLLRLFVLYFSSLYVVMISLFVLSTSCGDREEELNCRCWETNMGQEMYKLMLVQTLAEVGSILFVEGSHWLFTKISFRLCKNAALRINKVIGNIEFEISVSVLKLVYGEGLILFGVLFCPFLPAIGFVRNIIVFYLRTMAVFIFDKPPTTYFHVASTHTFYMAILLVTVFLSSLPVGFAMVAMRPSLRCGPFRGLDNMFGILVNEIETWPPALQTFVNFIQTPTFVLPVITILCIVVYYYAALGTALKKVNKNLTLQLKVEQNETRKIIAENIMAETIVDDQEKNSIASVALARASIGGAHLLTANIGGSKGLQHTNLGELLGGLSNSSQDKNMRNMIQQMMQVFSRQRMSSATSLGPLKAIKSGKSSSSSISSSEESSSGDESSDTSEQSSVIVVSGKKPNQHSSDLKKPPARRPSVRRPSVRRPSVRRPSVRRPSSTKK